MVTTPVYDVVDLKRLLESNNPHVEFMIVVDETDEKNYYKFYLTRAYDYLVKPVKTSISLPKNVLLSKMEVEEYRFLINQSFNHTKKIGFA